LIKLLYGLDATDFVLEIMLASMRKWAFLSGLALIA